MERETINHPEISEINVYPTLQDTADEAASCIAKHVKNFPHSTITYATGNTMIPFAQKLVEARVDFSDTQARHLDEYWYCSPENKDSFVRFLNERIFIPLGIKRQNIATINGLALDPRVEAQRYDDIVTKDIISKCIIGFGPGGHIGFTESSNNPNLFELRTHFQQLSKETVKRDRERGQSTPPTAITQGPSNIAEAENVVGIAYGADKGQILGEALYGPITTQNPATSLRRNGVGSKVTLFIDKEAAEQIELAKLQFEREKV